MLSMQNIAVVIAILIMLFCPPFIERWYLHCCCKLVQGLDFRGRIEYQMMHGYYMPGADLAGGYIIMFSILGNECVFHIKIQILRLQSGGPAVPW